MDSLRQLGLTPNRAASMTITFEGIEVVNYVYRPDGRGKVIKTGPNGERYAETETVHVRFVD